jgi:hypothetical protein
LTVVWPVEGFCTSIELPVTVAMVPVAPGNWRPEPLPPEPEPEPEPLVVAPEVVVVDADDDPHAASRAARAASAASASIRRVRTGRLARSAKPPLFGVAAFGWLVISSSLLVFSLSHVADTDYSLLKASIGASLAARPAG